MTDSHRRSLDINIERITRRTITGEPEPSTLTDGDQFNASVAAGDHSIDIGAVSQWGPNMPATFGRTIAPKTA